MADTKLKLEVIMAAVDRITRPLKSIMDGSRQTSGEVKALRDKIEDLNSQAGQIESFRKLQSQTAVVGHNMAAAQDKVRQLAQQLQATEAPTKALTRAFEAAKAEANKLTTQHGEMTQRVQRQRDALNAAGLATTALAGHQRRLKAEVQSTTTALDAEQKKLEAINQRAQKLKAAQAQYEKSKATAGNMAGTGATMAVAGAATVAPVVKTVADYSKFEDAMLGVARQVEGARDGNGKLTKTYYDMAQEIKRLSTTIPLATVEIAKIVEAGARMGIQGKENLIEFAKTTAMTATAFDMPVDQIGEQMGKLAQLYKIPIPAISTLGDTINWLDDNALSKGGDIIDVMQRIAGTAAGVNMVAKEAAALGSTFLSLGARAEVAATASNAMIRELSIATMQPKRFQEGIKALGLSAQGLQMGMPKDATGTILNVLDKLKALPADKRLEVATRIFGKEYGDDAAKLAENLDEYRRQLKLVNEEKAKGSMQREGDARNQTLSAGGQIVKNKFFNLTSAIGETQRETVAKIGQSIGDLLDRITAFVQANPGFVGAVVKIAAVMGGLLAVFGTIALAAAAILGPFAMLRLAFAGGGMVLPALLGLFAKLSGALMWVWRVGTFLVTKNPIAAFIVAVGVAIYDLVGRFDQLKALFNAGEWMQLGAAIWQGIEAGLNGATFGLYGLIKNIAQGLWSAFKWVLGINSPSKVFTELGGFIIDGLILGITNKVAQLKDTVIGLATSVAAWFKAKMGINSPSRVFMEFGGHTVAGLQNGIEANASGPIQAVQALAAKMAAAGAGLAVGMGGAMAAIDTRPPITASAAALGGGAGASVVNHITITAAPGMDTAALARMVAAEIDKATRRTQVARRSQLTDGD